MVSFESMLLKQISFNYISDGVIRIIRGALLLKIGALMQCHHRHEQHDK